LALHAVKEVAEDIQYCGGLAVREVVIPHHAAESVGDYQQSVYTCPAVTLEFVKVKADSNSRGAYVWVTRISANLLEHLGLGAMGALPGLGCGNIDPQRILSQVFQGLSTRVTQTEVPEVSLGLIDRPLSTVSVAPSEEGGLAKVGRKSLNDRLAEMVFQITKNRVVADLSDAVPLRVSIPPESLRFELTKRH